MPRHLGLSILLIIFFIIPSPKTMAEVTYKLTSQQQTKSVSSKRSKTTNTKATTAKGVKSLGVVKATDIPTSAAAKSKVKTQPKAGVKSLGVVKATDIPTNDTTKSVQKVPAKPGVNATKSTQAVSSKPGVKVLGTVKASKVYSDGRFRWSPGMSWDEESLGEHEPEFYRTIKTQCLAEVNQKTVTPMTNNPTAKNKAILEKYLQCLIRGLSHEIMGLESMRQEYAGKLTQSGILLQKQDPRQLVNGCYNLPQPKRRDSWSYIQLYFVCQEYLDKIRKVGEPPVAEQPEAKPAPDSSQLSLEELLAIPSIVLETIQQHLDDAPKLLHDECNIFQNSVIRYQECLANTDYYVQCVQDIYERVQQQNFEYNKRCLKRQSNRYPDSLIGEGYTAVEGPYISRQMLIDLRDDYLKICLYAKQQSLLKQVNNIREECRIIYQRYQLFADDDALNDNPISKDMLSVPLYKR